MTILPLNAMIKSPFVYKTKTQQRGYGNGIKKKLFPNWCKLQKLGDT